MDGSDLVAIVAILASLVTVALTTLFQWRANENQWQNSLKALKESRNYAEKERLVRQVEEFLDRAALECAENVMNVGAIRAGKDSAIKTHAEIIAQQAAYVGLGYKARSILDSLGTGADIEKYWDAFLSHGYEVSQCLTDKDKELPPTRKYVNDIAGIRSALIAHLNT